MNRYFFHLSTPEGYSKDEEGCLFPSLELAFLDASQAALELSVDVIRRRQKPTGYRFDITDDRGGLLLELPFSEILSARPSPSARPDPHVCEQISGEVARSRRLQADLAEGFAEARRQLAATRELLARTRPSAL